MNPELDKVITKFPIDSEVTYKGKAVGRVIGYRRANGKDALEVIFKHYEHLASGKEGQFSIRARGYTSNW